MAKEGNKILHPANMVWGKADHLSFSHPSDTKFSINKIIEILTHVPKFGENLTKLLSPPHPRPSFHGALTEMAAARKQQLKAAKL